jgi:hypothetical protein
MSSIRNNSQNVQGSDLRPSLEDSIKITFHSVTCIYCVTFIIDLVSVITEWRGQDEEEGVIHSETGSTAFSFMERFAISHDTNNNGLFCYLMAGKVANVRDYEFCYTNTGRVELYGYDEHNVRYLINSDYGDNWVKVLSHID